MKLGCCMNMLGDSKEPLGRKYIPVAAALGYDYLELALAQMMDLSETEFEELVAEVAAAGIPCECCNNFFPASLKITGPEADPARLEEYVRLAVGRARRLGAKRIVFGSSGAKNVPEGFDRQVAYKQIVDTLKMASRYAREAGILIVIEPLNRKESNIILNLQEGQRLAEDVGSPAVVLLVDYYHASLEGDIGEQMKKFIPMVHHIHFAQVEGRLFPREIKPEYQEFFSALKTGGYEERVSIEAFSPDPKADLEKGLMLRNLL